MIIKDEEKAKVYSSSILELEKVLGKIENEEERLLKEFDSNIREILGEELLNKLFQDRKPISNFLLSFHKSSISDNELKEEYEKKLSEWFKTKTEELRKYIENKDTAKEVNKYLPTSYALASLALTNFHEKPNMRLYEVQKLTGIAISKGNIAELGTGEGKTLSAVLPVYLQALRKKGVHVVTSNGYLSKRDYEETRPIFEGLGLSIGYTPESIEDLALIEGMNPNNLTDEERNELNKRIIKIKQDAYARDVTYGSKTAFAFDYLKDTVATKKEDIVQRKEKPGFALIDEVDDALIDDAECPYVLGGNLPIYTPNMDLKSLSLLLNVSYSDVKEKLQEIGMNINNDEKLSYEDARYIAVNLYSKELMPDSYSFQKRVQRFIERKINEDSVYLIKDIRFDGAKFEIKKEDFYEALTKEDECPYYIEGNDRNNQILINEYEKGKNASIICYKEKGEYRVSDSCYKEFLEYCYYAFQIRSMTLRNEENILNDNNYVNGIDYNIVEGHVVLTYDGAKKIVTDESHPKFRDDYNMYINLIKPHSQEMLNYLNQAIVANFFMRRNEDYIVQDGKVKVVNSGRVQDGSNYTNGLQQALEFKEKISYENLTRENLTVATITQKDFYSRYDGFSGMTGTSSKRVFSEVFDKDTTVVPRNAFYKFYSKRCIRKKTNSNKEPVGVTKKDAVFALDLDVKINLMVNSVVESLEKTPQQPVLLVVANPDEIKLISDRLNQMRISHYILDAEKEKSKEAEIIAKAGLPGAVTISTEMAGRGTDIKLGGDRDTIIDIATERHIRRVEERLGKPLNLTSNEREIVKKNVETSLLDYKGKKFLWTKEEEKTLREDLEKVGLKVISSGYFKIDRIDRQLEGRTGRNGVTGICERFACPNDLEYIGVPYIDHRQSVHEYFKKYPLGESGAIKFDDNARRKIDDKIKSVQINNEGIISQSILRTQNISRNSTKLMERYREERRKIIYSEDSLEYEVKNMIERTIDNLLVSYITEGIVSKENLLSELNSGKLKIDLETFNLELKSVLGLVLDVSSINKNSPNLLELRQAIIDISMMRYDEKKTSDKDRKTLLLANDYAISKLPSILDTSSNQMGLTSISLGMEDQAKYMASSEFYQSFRRMELEKDKYALKSLLGVNLTKEEQETLDINKEKLFGTNVVRDKEGYEVKEALYVENDGLSLDYFREIVGPIIKKSEEQREKLERKIEKKKNIDIYRAYSNLIVRPMQFTKAANSDEKLVLVQSVPTIENSKVMK